MVDISLGEDITLNIRLGSINFPDPRKASVAFEIFSEGHTFGDPQQPVLTISQEVLYYKTNDNSLPDYNRIIEAAANKLKSDFKRILDELRKTYHPLG